MSLSGSFKGAVCYITVESGTRAVFTVSALSPEEIYKTVEFKIPVELSEKQIFEMVKTLDHITLANYENKKVFTEESLVNERLLQRFSSICY